MVGTLGGRHSITVTGRRAGWLMSDPELLATPGMGMLEWAG